jgi:hypothetical protein
METMALTILCWVAGNLVIEQTGVVESSGDLLAGRWRRRSFLGARAYIFTSDDNPGRRSITRKLSSEEPSERQRPQREMSRTSLLQVGSSFLSRYCLPIVGIIAIGRPQLHGRFFRAAWRSFVISHLHLWIAFGKSRNSGSQRSCSHSLGHDQCPGCAPPLCNSNRACMFLWAGALKALQ